MYVRLVDTKGIYTEAFPYPLALAQVCRLWRRVVLGTPSLWANVNIVGFGIDKSKSKALVRAYLDRSKLCPLFLTWFSDEPSLADAQTVVDELIMPSAERLKRITLFACGGDAPKALLTAMGTRDFPILRDVEITTSCLQVSLLDFTGCKHAPLLHRWKIENVLSRPSLPSNLVVLDYQFTMWDSGPIRLDPLIEVLPHVAHSLEHLRFVTPRLHVSVTPCRSNRSRIPLQNLKSLLVLGSHAVMDHILTPNLTYLAVNQEKNIDVLKVAKMFDGFSAPKLQTLKLYQTPLLPLITRHNLPSKFPQLESVAVVDCTDESALISLLVPPEQEGPGSEYWPKRHRFPKLNEVTMSMSDQTDLAPLQAAVNWSERADRDTCNFTDYLTRRFSEWGIKFIPDKCLDLEIPAPAEFQDEFHDRDYEFFDVIARSACESVLADDESDPSPE